MLARSPLALRTSSRRVTGHCVVEPRCEPALAESSPASLPPTGQPRTPSRLLLPAFTKWKCWTLAPQPPPVGGNIEIAHRFRRQPSPMWPHRLLPYPAAAIPPEPANGITTILERLNQVLPCSWQPFADILGKEQHVPLPQGPRAVSGTDNAVSAPAARFESQPDASRDFALPKP